MAFTPTVQPERYVKVSAPLLDASQKTYLENELRNLSKSVDSLVAAIEEIQEHLKTLP